MALLDHRDDGGGERLLVLVEEGGRAQRRFALLVVEQPVHARLVVGRGEQARELLGDRRFDVLRDLAVAPVGADERGGIVPPPDGEIGAGEEERAVAGDRLLAVEGV